MSTGSERLHAGNGTLELTAQPNHTSSIRTLKYQYPLKLVVPKPLVSQDGYSVQTLYLLSYGGGLVSGDKVSLDLSLDTATRLVILTQGSTKIYPSPEPIPCSQSPGETSDTSPSTFSSQVLNIRIGLEAGLCYLPDPIQPFAQSAFAQRQIYDIPFESIERTGNMCVLDWVSSGRAARGEAWAMRKYSSRNEIWLHDTASDQKRLLLRDNLLLDADFTAAREDRDIPARMNGLGVYGTLMIYGEMFATLSRFFLDEFKALPRIGGRTWDAEHPLASEHDTWRKERQRQEVCTQLLWTVSYIRRCTVVKFAAREVQGAKAWLAAMLEREGSVPRRFGQRALLCLR